MERERRRMGVSDGPKPDDDELESWKELAEKSLYASEPAENSDRPEYPDRGLRDEIEHLAVEAYRRELISRGRLMDLGAILEIHGETLLDIAERACDS